MHSNVQVSETTHLVRAARDGDEAAFTRLFDEIAPALYAWVELRLRGDRSAGSRVEPGDVVQEVWLRAWRGLEHFEPDEVPFRPGIFRVAKNVMLEAWRQASRTRQAKGAGPTTRLFALENLPDGATSISRRLARDETLAQFGERVLALSEEDRKLVVHCGLEGMPRKDVAVRMGLSTEAVNKRWQRLRDRLAEAGLPEHLTFEPG